MDAFKGHEVFFITYDNFRTRQLPYKKYLLENIGTNPLKMLKAFLKIGKIIAKERPKRKDKSYTPGTWGMLRT
ncbi:Capsular polysaccharide biosynthesis protein [Thermococcus sibiricus MM 739]|uniref:Capsular polysaccharide biosynthesis protein n=2 Tax=Thermococcus sibiricus TaxID=172049 RepID=C6A0D0_THESM|nr:Capsular polysaccharide biosynthesis protein [Thermococcus sibiricus MM 739]